jgi:hypothetical protein
VISSEQRALLGLRIADALNDLAAGGENFLAVEYTREGPKRIIIGSGTRSVWLLMDYVREDNRLIRRYSVHGEPVDDCLEPYDHDGHVWQSRDGARRCPGALRPVEGGTSLTEKRR